ncbi:MAG TPA: hypothetical protein DD412_01660 [Holosporales bacterium]|nr:hypothetical protein [Holosporales bacterium]
MKITDLLKKVSLVAAVSAFALPAYASDHELDIVEDEMVGGPKIAVVDTVGAGPFTFSIIDTTTGEGLLEKTKRKMTVTNGSVEQVVSDVDGFIGKYSFFVKGEGDAASSNGLFNLGGVVFDLSTAIKDEVSLGEAVETHVAPFLASLADSEEHALEAAKEKALTKKAEAEEVALALKLAEEEALALKLAEEEEARELEEAERLEALKLEDEEVAVVDEDNVVGEDL